MKTVGIHVNASAAPQAHASSRMVCLWTRTQVTFVPSRSRIARADDGRVLDLGGDDVRMLDACCEEGPHYRVIVYFASTTCDTHAAAGRLAGALLRVICR